MGDTGENREGREGREDKEDNDGRRQSPHHIVSGGMSDQYVLPEQQRERWLNAWPHVAFETLPGGYVDVNTNK